MHKSKKGGLPADQMVSALAFMIFFSILIIVAFGVISRAQSNKEKQVEASIGNINADYNLNYFLRLRLEGGKTVSELIGVDALNNNFVNIKTLSDIFFGEIYTARGASYDLKIGEKRINSVIFKDTIGHSSAQIPIISKNAMNVELFAGQEKQSTIPLK